MTKSTKLVTRLKSEVISQLKKLILHIEKLSLDEWDEDTLTSQLYCYKKLNQTYKQIFNKNIKKVLYNDINIRKHEIRLKENQEFLYKIAEEFNVSTNTMFYVWSKHPELAKHVEEILSPGVTGKHRRVKIVNDSKEFRIKLERLYLMDKKRRVKR